MLGDGQISMLPRGVEEYLERRTASLREEDARLAAAARASAQSSATPVASQSEQREARKTVARIDRQLAKLAEQEAALHAALAEHASDYEKLAELDARLRELLAHKEDLEEEWLDAAALLD
jgi:ABC transport system ATP-binding/permease protein